MSLHIIGDERGNCGDCRRPIDLFLNECQLPPHSTGRDILFAVVQKVQVMNRQNDGHPPVEWQVLRVLVRNVPEISS